MVNAPVFVQSAMMPATQLELTARIALWQESVKRLSAAVEEERVNRAYLIEHWFPNFEEGTHTGALSDGYNLKCTMPVNRTVDQERYRKAFDYAYGHSDNEQTRRRIIIARERLDTIFRLKAELNVSAWKNADSDLRLKFADFVTEKPGTPALKYVERK